MESLDGELAFIKGWLLCIAAPIYTCAYGSTIANMIGIFFSFP